MSSENAVIVSIKPITVDNWKKASALEVMENQVNFVAPNVRSIAESSFYETAYNYGIFNNEVMVGFILIFNPPEEPELGHIVRFMTDKNQQRKGLGTKGLEQIIELFSKEYNKKIVTLTVLPDNQDARAFYEAVGFVNTNEIVEGEIKYKYTMQ